MTVRCGTYYGATQCSSGPMPGAKGAMSWFTGAYREERGTNLGIFNCRTVRGGVSTSIHGQGRAWDFGTPVVNDWSWKLVELIRLHSEELGVQCLIHRRKIWSSNRCDEGWRNYTGVAAHFDHIHGEQTPAAAARSQQETAELWQRVLGDPSPVKGDGHVIPAPRPPAVVTGPTIKMVQDRLNGLAFGPLTADGIPGPQTEAATRRFQQAAGLTVDGDFGPASWAASNKVPAYPWGNESRAFQQRLKDRGWSITVDGAWGPKSASTLARFQAEKGLDADGKIGPMTWTALWTRGT